MIRTQYTRHGDQMRPRVATDPDKGGTDSQTELSVGEGCSSTQDDANTASRTPESLGPKPVVLRRSKRVVNPPARFVP